MRLNKSLFYLHRCIAILNTFAFFYVIACITEDKASYQKYDTILNIVIGIILIFALIHFKASNEASKGTKLGKWLSKGIGILFVIQIPFCFVIKMTVAMLASQQEWISTPLCISIGVIMIVLASENHWQSKDKNN